MGAGASTGKLTPPMKCTEARPIFSGLERLKATLQTNEKWTIEERDEVNALLRKAEKFYDAEIEEVTAVRTVLEKTRDEKRQDFLEVYSRILKMVQNENDFEKAMKIADQIKDNESKTHRRSQSDDAPRQNVNNLAVLFENSISILPKFDEFVHGLARMSNAKEVKVAPLKSIGRAFEKTALKTENRYDADRVLDIIRGMLLFDSMTNMAKALEKFGNGKLNWSICRIKNRMKPGNQTTGGWADILLNIHFNDDPHAHICELQLVHIKMYSIRDTVGGHETYEAFRIAEEFLALTHAPVTGCCTCATLRAELEDAKKNRDFKRAREIKTKLTAVETLDKEIDQLSNAIDNAANNDNFDEAERLQGIFEKKEAERNALAKQGPGQVHMKQGTVSNHQAPRNESSANPIESHVERLRFGTAIAKEQAAEALEVLARDNPEHRVTIAEAGAIPPLVDLLTSGTAIAIQNAAGALWKLGRNDKNVVTIAEARAIPPLVDLLTSGTADAKENAAGALLNLALHEKNRVTIAEAGTIPPLVDLLTSGTADGKRNAAGALRNLAYENDKKSVTIAEAGAIPPLVDLLTSGTADGKRNAAGALRNLAVNDKNQVTIAEAGAIPPLVNLLTSGTADAKEMAAGALRNLTFNNNKNKVTIAEAGAIPPLVNLLTSGTANAKENAASALWNLADINDKKKVIIAEAGAIPPLVNLVKINTARKYAAGVLKSLSEIGNLSDQIATAKRDAGVD